MSMQDVQSELEEFRRDIRWYSSHYDELREQYPDHWIAVYQEKLVGASPDMDEMFAGLKRQRVPATKAYIKHLSTEDEVWTF